MTQVKQNGPQHLRSSRPQCPQNPTEAAYTRYADRYLAYADGDVWRDLFDFGPHRPFGWIDREVWRVIAERVEELCAGHKDELTVLDVGCGPGTWSARLARAFGPRLRRLRITAVDLSAGQLKNARALLDRVGAAEPGHVEIQLQQADVCQGLDAPDGAFDLTLCLNTVLNHLDPEQMGRAVREMMRLTGGSHVTTVRGRWGAPTAYVGALDDFRAQQEGNVVRCRDSDNREFELPSYLYSGRELRDTFATVGDVTDCYGLDFLVSKVLGTGSGGAGPFDRSALECGLRQLEESHRRDWRFLDLANHVVIVARPFTKPDRP